MENTNAFFKGWLQITNGSSKQVKEEIMRALEITTTGAWYNRLYGKVIPNKEEVEKIEKIFSEHGITEVWG